MRRRIARRVAVVAMGVVVPMLATAGPALAQVKPDDGEVPGPPLSTGAELFLFVVLPLAGFLLIAALSVLPSALSRPRYRPGKAWDHDAAWIGDPMDSVPAAVTTPTGDTAQGGASAEW